MKYEDFLKALKDYVESVKEQANILYQDDKTVSFVEEILDQKYNHTKRVVLYIVDLSRKLNVHINFEKIAVEGGLFHDIGRFKQGLYHRTYNDSIVFPKGGNHGEYGYELVTSDSKEKVLFDKLVLDKERSVVKETILYHQRTELPDDYSYHMNEDIRYSDPFEFLTGSTCFNEYEKIILSALLHMVRDADRMDILWQRATGEIKPYKELFSLRNNGNVNEIAKRWGVSEELIHEYNDEDVISNNSHIIIPRKSIPIEKLFISNDLKEKMKKFETLDLRMLQQRSDFTSIVALWWTIYTFLKDMNFVGNLKQVKERGLLDKIYSIYPNEYHPVIDEIFDFAKNTLIDEQLENNKDNIYLVRKK